MHTPPHTFADRVEGLRLGLAAGRRRAGHDPAADGALALARVLEEELAGGRIDFRRLAERWVGEVGPGAPGLEPATAAGLDWLARHGAPPPPGSAPAGTGPLAHLLPIAVVAATAPAALLSGTYHAALLTDPHESSAWAAVGVNVAAARLLTGSRDPLPDVIEALRVNDAPSELLDALREVPLAAPDELAGAGRSPAATALALAVWLAQREPVVPRGLDRIAALDAGALAPAAALAGARDGAAATRRWAGGAVADRTATPH